MREAASGRIVHFIPEVEKYTYLRDRRSIVGISLLGRGIVSLTENQEDGHHDELSLIHSYHQSLLF
jgi:hypothetical protein